MSKEHIRRILEAGHAAPSGENAQPWHFRVEEGEPTLIEISIEPARDQSLYAWKNRSAYVAVGAAIENMRHAAVAEGFDAQIDLMRESSKPLMAATISLTKNPTSSDPLAEAIRKRSTNRKPFEKKPLSRELRERIQISENDIRLDYIEDPAGIGRLASAASAAEQVMLANADMHHFFFDHINWSAQEDEKNRIGFFIDTLELPPPARMGFKVLSSWNRAQFLNKYLSFNKVVAKQNAAIYASCSAIGIVSAESESVLSAIRAGMLFERVWLEATLANWWLQPLAGIVFLGLRVKAVDLGSLTSSDARCVAGAYKTIKDEFHLGKRTPYMMFRIGAGEAPSARSKRLPLEDVLVT